MTTSLMQAAAQDTDPKISGQPSSEHTIICVKCSVPKTLDHFHLKGKASKGKIRYHSRCKECVSQDGAKKYSLKKSLLSATRKRRAKTKVLDVSQMSIKIVPSYCSHFKKTDIMREFIEAVLCNRAKN